MTTMNAVGVTLSDASGTGNFAGTISPTLVTPTLGAANATSVNFGGSTLSTYVGKTSFTPTISFDTPGDLTVAYTVQIGRYYRIGDIGLILCEVTFTPTYTTASGVFDIQSMPFTFTTVAVYEGTVSSSTGITGTPAGAYLTSETRNGATELSILYNVSGSGRGNLNTGNFLSGTQYNIRCTITVGL